MKEKLISDREIIRVKTSANDFTAVKLLPEEMCTDNAIRTVDLFSD